MDYPYQIPDSLAAVRSYLLADPIVNGLVDGRIYGGSLDLNVVAGMPTEVVVLTPAGGLGEGGQGFAPLMGQRIDAKSYGHDDNTAWSVHLAVRGALKALKRKVFNNCLLHSVSVDASGSLSYDDEGQWPMVLGVYSVLSAEVPVSV